MKLLHPINLSKTKAKPVTKWSQIEDDAMAMLERIEQKNFGPNIEDAHAIHHAQVSKDPYNFFVVHPEHTAPLFNGNLFIINPVIVEKAPVVVSFHEGCLSYPHRKQKKTRRHVSIKVRYETVNKNGTGLVAVEEHELNRLSAIIFQHEIDHANGTDIYTRFKK